MSDSLNQSNGFVAIYTLRDVQPVFLKGGGRGVWVRVRGRER